MKLKLLIKIRFKKSFIHKEFQLVKVLKRPLKKIIVSQIKVNNEFKDLGQDLTEPKEEGYHNYE